MAEVADFIQSVRNRLTHVPTADEVGSVLKAVNELQRLFERAEMSPTLSLALGIEAARPSPRRRAAPTLSSTVSVDEVSSRFGDLTVDQLREKLSDEHQLSIAEIRGIAKALGARAGSRVGRDALVANIVTKITNLRGYRALGPASESQVGKKERT